MKHRSPQCEQCEDVLGSVCFWQWEGANALTSSPARAVHSHLQRAICNIWRYYWLVRLGEALGGWGLSAMTKLPREGCAFEDVWRSTALEW